MNVETCCQLYLRYHCACWDGANSEKLQYLRISLIINGEEPAKIGGPVLLTFFNFPFPNLLVQTSRCSFGAKYSQFCQLLLGTDWLQNDMHLWQDWSVVSFLACLSLILESVMVSKCSCPVIRSHADVKDGQISFISAVCVRIYSTNISRLGNITAARVVSYGRLT